MIKDMLKELKIEVAISTMDYAEEKEKLEPGRGFEPRTPSLPWRCSAC